MQTKATVQKCLETPMDRVGIVELRLSIKWLTICLRCIVLKLHKNLRIVLFLIGLTLGEIFYLISKYL